MTKGAECMCVCTPLLSVCTFRKIPMTASPFSSITASSNRVYLSEFQWTKWSWKHTHTNAPQRVSVNWNLMPCVFSHKPKLLRTVLWAPEVKGQHTQSHWNILLHETEMEQHKNKNNLSLGTWNWALKPNLEGKNKCLFNANFKNSELI